MDQAGWRNLHLEGTSRSGRRAATRSPNAADAFSNRAEQNGGALRSQVAAILAEDPELIADEDAEDEHELDAEEEPVAMPVAVTGPKPVVEPPSWIADRLDLTPEIAAPFLGSLLLPPGVVDQTCAALSAGKHLLLVGPPGTGKTALAEAAKSEEYCHGAFVATASADWTTFDTIGGHALQKDSGLAFRSGAFLQAVERWQWLVIDELNRADADRAFGELMTVRWQRTRRGRRSKAIDRPQLRKERYHQAHLYAREYAEVLTGWPKAILVATLPMTAGVQADDDVIAVDWQHWVPAEVAQAITPT